MSHPLRTNSAAVATHHPLAADAAAQILRGGGNAADAAVAALSTLCVVLPGSVGFGGYGGSLVFRSAKTGKTTAIDFDSRCPLAFHDGLFAGDPHDKSNVGYLAVTVPGIIAGLSLALEKFGTKSWREVTRRAIELAEGGVPMEPDPRRHLERWHAETDPVSRRAHFPDERIPDVDEPWVQPDLAGMLRTLADQGPRAFYEGEIPRQICQQVRAHGGILSEEDFAKYRATVVEPLTINYRGHDLFTPPPPSGGITMLQILKTLEQFDLADLERWGAPYLHLVAEASKLCFGDRKRTLGDPDFVRMPLDELLSVRAAAARAAELRRRDIRTGVENQVDTGPHTSNVSIIDREGNVVSLTATQGYQFGSRVVIDGLGLVMGHGMSRFTFAPNHPNRPQPGKRMHHNMCPTLLLKDGKPFGAIGLPGGPKIITVSAQIVINLVDFHCTAHQAVLAPRVHSEGDEPICVSGSLAKGIVRELEAMGHQVTLGQSVGGPPNEVGGPANAVVFDREGNLTAASSAAPDAAAVL
jgi:gamma-glutamyltranspeptidase/glutathione hydrolase